MREWSVRAGELTIVLNEAGMVTRVRSRALELLGAPAPLAALEIEDIGPCPLEDFDIAEAVQGADGARTLTSLRFCHRIHPAQLRADFLTSGGEATFSLSVAIDWPDAPGQTFLSIPFLAELAIPGGRARYPHNPCPKPDGQSAAQLHAAFPLPMCLSGEDGAGVSIAFPIEWPGLAWDQNRNQTMNQIGDERGLRGHHLRLRPGRCMAVAVEARMAALSGGWPEAFSRWREAQRAEMDLSEYARPDLQWAREKQFHHFSYLYGSEACDGDESQPNLGALIDSGAPFGGYDALLLWHQYPRLGLDGRSQWDFYRDFPGGRSGLKALAQKARERGVRVFLPFKPWDAGRRESPDQAVAEMAKLVIECEIDGVFFDTMDAVPAGLREAIDRARPGVVFLTEGRPANRRSLEQITCSWDQYWSEQAMPEIDLTRFLLPEHASPMIARWHEGARKSMLIRRAAFCGVGLVIWQDVFGAWMPYSAAQQAEIAHWKRIFLEHRALFESESSIPLLDTAQPGLYANLFPGEGEAIIALYNASDRPLEGCLLRGFPYESARDLWQGHRMAVSAGVLTGRIPREELAIVYATAAGGRKG